MNNYLDYQLGRVVYSRSGRDAGRCFVVVCQLEEGFVGIADGCIRKLANPKKKKLKHLDPKPAVLQAIAQKLANHQKVYDSEIRSALEAAGFNNRA